MLTYKHFKVRICEVCERVFVPDRMGQLVCRPACAMARVRQAKKAEQASIKARKEAIKTIPALIREAQVAFNAWVRARDFTQPCISCDAPPPDLSGLHAGRDAGHYRSTGSASHLRFQL